MRQGGNVLLQPFLGLVVLPLFLAVQFHHQIQSAAQFHESFILMIYKQFHVAALGQFIQLPADGPDFQAVKDAAYKQKNCGGAKGQCEDYHMIIPPVTYLTLWAD